MAAADDGGGRLVQQPHVAAQKQNRRRGQPLRQHFGEIFILKQHQAASVPHFPFQRRFCRLPRQSAFFRIAPSLKRVLMPHRRGNLFRRCGQGILRAAETAHQQQETFRADIGRKRQLQPRETFVLCHKIHPLTISDGIFSKCRLKTKARSRETGRPGLFFGFFPRPARNADAELFEFAVKVRAFQTDLLRHFAHILTFLGDVVLEITPLHLLP